VHVARRLTLLGLVCLAVLACGSPESTAPRPARIPPPTSAPEGPLVVFLGDSLTAGFGLGESQAFPAVIGDKLVREGRPIRVVNAGVSGDTSAGGRRRLDWVLGLRPDVVVVGLGANDGLRGQPVDSVEANLRAIIVRAREAGARVVLLGMRLPPNLGPTYVREFEAIYPRLARELDVPLVPFLLKGVAARPGLNLEDGIHPNAEGQQIVADNVLPVLERTLAELSR
jgi:acyl-CoA thioesterase I